MNENVRLLANRYEVEKEAGRGGTSIVYKAYDRQAEGAVRAIKEISKANRDIYDMAKQESALIKELYEADKINAFFPNIIHRFESENHYYIVQDYLDGKSMDKLLDEKPMSDKEFIEAAKQICLFMRFFHSRGMVHSDMKPENIMVLNVSSDYMNGGSAIKLKFIDFGTAILNMSGVSGYTPEYAAPEQYRVLPLDKRTDIFNIGATFYHMIEGKKPLRVDNGTRMLSSQERFVFSRNVSPAIKRIIQKCVEDDPSKRYQSCDALYKELCHIEKKTSLRIVTALAALSVLCFIASGVLTGFAKKKDSEISKENYIFNVNKGNYAEAIKIDHTNRDGIYSKLIDDFTSDNMLDTDEDNFIINEIKSRDAIKETDSDYGKCMYEIANAYWLYYFPYNDSGNENMSEEEQKEYNMKMELELEKSRIFASSEWFEKAVGSSDLKSYSADAYRRAEIFSGICRFYSDIDRMEKIGSDSAEFYNDMWKNIEALAEYIDEPNDVVSVRVCQTLLSLLSKYSAKFSRNGVEQSTQEKILEHIVSKVYQNGDISYSNDYARSIAELFNPEAVHKKLDMAYADSKER
jgi:serine/threonine-protein kinase